MKQKTAYRREWLLLAALGPLAAIVLWAALAERARLPGNVGRSLTETERAEVIARNSPLTDYVSLSPLADFPREGAVEKITIHHMAGDLTLERLGEIFSDGDRRASANYGIDTEGRIGLYVEEGNRSWASGSPENDHRAVTIEVANSETGGEWPVSGEAYEALIRLCADICRRNGIDSLAYTGDGTGNLTLHSMFADTECPGPYLTERMADIAKEVNRRLNAGLVLGMVLLAGTAALAEEGERVEPYSEEIGSGGFELTIIKQTAGDAPEHEKYFTFDILESWVEEDRFGPEEYERTSTVIVEKDGEFKANLDYITSITEKLDPPAGYDVTTGYKWLHYQEGVEGDVSFAPTVTVEEGKPEISRESVTTVILEGEDESNILTISLLNDSGDIGDVIEDEDTESGYEKENYYEGEYKFRVTCEENGYDSGMKELTEDQPSVTLTDLEAGEYKITTAAIGGMFYPTITGTFDRDDWKNENESGCNIPYGNVITIFKFNGAPNEKYFFSIYDDRYSDYLIPEMMDDSVSAVSEIYNEVDAELSDIAEPLDEEEFLGIEGSSGEKGSANAEGSSEEEDSIDTEEEGFADAEGSPEEGSADAEGPSEAGGSSDTESSSDGEGFSDEEDSSGTEDSLDRGENDATFTAFNMISRAGKALFVTLGKVGRASKAAFTAFGEVDNANGIALLDMIDDDNGHYSAIITDEAGSRGNYFVLETDGNGYGMIEIEIPDNFEAGTINVVQKGVDRFFNAMYYAGIVRTDDKNAELSPDGDRKVSFGDGYLEGGKGTLLVTNTYIDKRETGRLTIHKKIEGSDANPDDEFHFKVTLYKDGALWDYTPEYKKHGIFFENGVATFTLKGGEHKEIASLPLEHEGKKITYKVEELDSEGNPLEDGVEDSKGYTVTIPGNAEGEVKVGETGVVFVNHKDGSELPPPPTPDPKRGIYKYVHEYYYKDADGKLTLEGISSISTSNEYELPDDEQYNENNVGKVNEYNGVSYTYDSAAYGTVTGSNSYAKNSEMKYVVVTEDGVPKAYVKFWDPEEEEWLYIPEEDVPLGYMLPRTGDSGSPWALLAIVSVCGLIVFAVINRRRKKD